MSFRVLLSSGERRAFEFTADEWAQLKALSREDRTAVRCPPPCGDQLIPKTSHRGTKYFAHRPGSAVCKWAGESEEHLEAKEITRQVVSDREGWAASVEHDHGDWQADVLATRGRFKCALEIQLSAQGQAITSEREARYDAAGVLTWWLVNERNGGEGFGSHLRTIVPGSSSSERLAALPSVVEDILSRVETQSRLARAVRDSLRRREVVFETMKRGEMPSLFVFEIEGRQQHIVIGELGRGTIPDFRSLCSASPENEWGSVVQFVSRAPHIRGFGSTSFRVDREPIESRVDTILTKLFSGMVWQAEDEVEAAFVWYREECVYCEKPFARTPFVVAAHRRRWPDHGPRLVNFSAVEQEEAAVALRRFTERIGLPTGPISTPWPYGREGVREAAEQRCPHCGCKTEKSRISRQEALSWPGSEVDFLLTLPKKQRRWAVRSMAAERKAPSRKEWDRLIEQRKPRAVVQPPTDYVEPIPWFDD